MTTPDRSSRRVADVADLAPSALLRLLAAEADVDIRTAAHVLRGGPIRSRSARRVLRAARALGIAIPLAPELADVAAEVDR